MTKGEVCPNEVKIGRNRVVKATRRPETRLIERKTGSWFQNGACSATIGAEFGSYLGNVGSEAICSAQLDIGRSNRGFAGCGFFSAVLRLGSQLHT